MKTQSQSTFSFPCTNCGSALTYQPGTTEMACQHCGTRNELPLSQASIPELDYKTYLAQRRSKEETYQEYFVDCQSCGAASSVKADISSAFCPYCATPLVVEDAYEAHLIPPGSLLPFKLNQKEAQSTFKTWIDKLWFAPSVLKKTFLHLDHFKGVYVPYWTFDAETTTQYAGKRGAYYYVTETYQEIEDGRSVQKTRQKRKTRWYGASGQVHKFFDDVLIPATQSLPSQELRKLAPWDLGKLQPFAEEYLSGFITEKYQVELEAGFGQAQQVMEPEIRRMVEWDIGGDEQRISSLRTQYRDIRFKHVLLPVYVSAYRYKGKLFQFLVNARTGEVQGQRPYSALKITLAVIAGLVALGLIYYFTQQ